MGPREHALRLLQGSAEAILFGNISTAEFCEIFDGERGALWPEDNATGLIDEIAACVLEWHTDRRMSTTDDLRVLCRRVSAEVPSGPSARGT
ncbi:MAG: hypothetical protein JWP14_2818 [Frankiales bacterium]|jgi:hypothetical protein|nr:hypothetical protein [Frankiales bacterium]